MANYKYHILLCGGTGCTASDSPKIKENFEQLLVEKNLTNDVQVIATGCFGFCEKGPIVKILPDNTFYTQVKPEDCREIIDEHIVAVPPERVYTYNGHFQEGVPEHVGYKPAGGSINHARLPGIYTVMLVLSAGYRWADGSTDPKAVMEALPSVVYDGVSGHIEFDEKGDAKRDSAVIKTVNTETGEWEFVGEQKVG